MNKSKSGITLIELSIGILLVSILLAGLLMLFSSGLRGAAKGLSHLDLMESANMLLAQIEHDLLRTVEPVEVNSDGSEATWKQFFVNDDSIGEALVSYRLEENGVRRQMQIGDRTDNYIYCRGARVRLIFSPFYSSEYDTHGVWIELELTAPERGVADAREVFSLNRAIICRNLSDEIDHY